MSLESNTQFILETDQKDGIIVLGRKWTERVCRGTDAGQRKGSIPWKQKGDVAENQPSAPKAKMLRNSNTEECTLPFSSCFLPI